MSRASVSPFGRSRGFGPHWFEPWSSETNDWIDTCHFLAKHSELLGWGEDWFTQYQDNVTEWIKSWYWWPDLSMGQHYKVTMSVDSSCHDCLFVCCLCVCFLLFYVLTTSNVIRTGTDLWRQVSILKSLGWLDQGSNPRGSDSTISGNGRRIFYSFSLIDMTVDVVRM